MANINKEILNQIGNRLKDRRTELSYSQADISSLSGLTVNTISSVENGGGTTMNNFLLLCRSLRLQPRDVFLDDIVLDSMFELPPNTRRRLDVTQRLHALVHDSNFFDQPRRVSEVLKTLELDSAVSNKFSVYLTGYCNEGVLVAEKSGKINKYRKNLI